MTPREYNQVTDFVWCCGLGLSALGLMGLWANMLAAGFTTLGIGLAMAVLSVRAGRR